jgi:hypothetical protein
MRITILVVAMVLLVGCDESSSSLSDLNSDRLVQSGPVSHFDLAELNLGRVLLSQRNGTVSGSFCVTNIGNAPLVFGEMIVSCGCLAATANPNVLRPGESGTIDLTVKLDKPGEKTVRATIHTNEPLTIPAQLRLSVIAVAPLEVEPPRIDFGSLLTGIQRSVTFVLSVAPEADCQPDQIKIKTAESANSWGHSTLSPPGRQLVT